MTNFILPRNSVFLLFLVTFLSAPEGALGCPLSVSAICKCQLFINSGLQLDCSFANFTEVTRVLQEANSPIESLRITGSDLPALPRHAFGSLLIQGLDLSGNNISTISEEAFLGQGDKLTSLKLANNSLRAVPVLPGLRELTSLDLSGNSISDIPPNIFTHTPKLNQLRMEKNRICDLNLNALEEAKQTLALLDLSGNCLSRVPAQNLRGAQRLTYLDLSENRILDLPNLQLMNLPALREVRLNGNRIATMGPLAFMNVPELQVLLLGNNSIRTLEPNRYQVFEKLETLDLSHNGISKVPNSAFKEVKSLTQLILDHNRIESVETLAFSSNPQLQLISLQNNKIQTLFRNAFDNLPQMVILLLANNSLTSVGRGVFTGMQNLQQLNLRSNEIETLEGGAVFSSLPQLTTLDLGENRLGRVPPDAFRGLGKLFWLDLCCNGLQTFPEGTFKEKISNILLHGNRLECNSSLDWFVTYLVTHNVRTFLPEQPEVTCAGPPKYAGVQLKELMIKKANESFYKTFNNLLPAGQESSAIPLGNLIPGLSEIPGLERGIPGLTTAIPGLNALTNAVPGLNLVPGLNTVTNPVLSAAGDNGLVPALSSFANPIGRVASNGRASAKDLTDLIASIPGLVEQLPTLPGTNLNMADLPPELIDHVLSGGQVPGVPKATLDRIVKETMQTMAEAAAAANAGRTTLPDGTETSTVLPDLATLPSSLTESVLSGEPLPYLTTAQTEEIKNYYLSRTGVSAGGGGGTISASQLLGYLPQDVDLSQLPPQLLQQIASGQPLDVSLIPRELIEAVREKDPELVARLEAGGGGGPSAGAELDILNGLPPLQTLRPSETIAPYDLAKLDRQNEIKDPTAEGGSEEIALYTGIGLACVALVTVLTVGYLCYRRRKALPESLDEMDRTKFFGPAVTSSPKASFDSISVIPSIPHVSSQRSFQHQHAQQQHPPYYYSPGAPAAFYGL